MGVAFVRRMASYTIKPVQNTAEHISEVGGASVKTFKKGQNHQMMSRGVRGEKKSEKQ